MKTLVLFLLFLVPLLARDPQPGGVARQVLSFYYGWYGAPHHWENVDAAAKTIGSSTNWPRLGPYDSHDPKVIDQHCRWAKDAGLTGFIATWWVQNDYHDQGLPLLLDSAAKHGLKVTIYYELAPPAKTPTVAGAVGDLLYLLEKYGKHPAWLQVDGKPVLFIYGRAIGQLKLPAWRQVIEQVKQRTPAVFIGDRLSDEAARTFDGIHTYNPTAKTAGLAPGQIRAWADQSYADVVRMAAGKISAVTIIPGYDDHKLGRPDPRPITARHGGQTYTQLWEAALSARPDWVLITSFNEWHEGSEIEPSLQDGDRYLKLTKKYAPKFMRLR